MKRQNLILRSFFLGSAIILASCTPYAEPQITDAPITTEMITIERTTEAPTVETTVEETTEFSIYNVPFEPKKVNYERAYPNLTFEQPLFLTHHDGLIYVVEKTGKIKRFQDDDLVSEFEVFADFSDRIDKSANEKGLLGFAFHPNFDENGIYFVYYTDRQGSVIAKHSSGQEGEILLRFPQPYANHNGGHIEFGLDGSEIVVDGAGLQM